MKYTVKKIAGLIITLLIVSMLAFLAFELIPGDPARSILGTEATESKVQALREEMGLNRPLDVYKRQNSFRGSAECADRLQSHRS